MNANELKQAYAYCENITRQHAKSFYFAAKFLPKDKQPPIYALYALCRSVDDEVDEIGVDNEEKAIQAIENWKEKLDVIYSQESKVESQEQKDSRLKTQDSRLVLLAWQDLLKTYKIPQNLPLELMKGVLMDTTQNRYETFDELYVYCYRVASVVGLMSSEIFGYQGGKKTLDYAEALGIGMQLTNILRDVKEDAAMNRIYLPKQDLERFNITEQDIFDNNFNDNFTQMMKFQVERAKDYYKKADKGIPFLEKDTRFCVLLASRIYGRILNEIEKQNYNVFNSRVSTTKIQKILSIPKIWLESKKL